MLLRSICVIIIVQTFFVSCAKNRSLTFVIDDTPSMQDVINQVQWATRKIFDIVTSKKGGEIKDVVLVTFNDPEVVLRIKTSFKKSFLHSLRNVITRNSDNFDCPEYALSGIITALNESRDESYIYVFTDASAKDHRRLNEVKRFCEKKQSQVVIVLTGDCVNYVGEELGSLSVYYEIARASNGLVFVVSKEDVGDIVNTIPETISDQRSVIKYKVIRAGPIFTPIEFTVDDKTEYVTIHTSGKNVEFDLTDDRDHSIKYETILWKKTAKMVKLYPKRTGRYIAWVRGNTDVTLVVYAATDFTFDHGFSEFVPKSLTDASKQPIADQPHYLSISLTDPDHTVYIISAEILDMDETVIGSLPLEKASGDFYITERFKSPSTMFKIQVTGIVKKTGKEIKRSSKTAIEPQIPPPPAAKAPVITITDGSSVDVDYGGEVVLTCKVSAYPTPRIRWTSAAGTTISAKSNIVEPPYEYISYLKLSNVRHRGDYYCRAENIEDSKFSKVSVNPNQPFRVQTRPGTIQALYGMEKQIPCDISSPYPLDIQWKTPLKPSDYTLSADKMVLTIKSADLSAQGLYACEASLKADPRQKHVTNTNIVISGLAPPTILSSHTGTDTITVSYGGKVQIKCKISGGVPRPSVGWKVLKTNEDQYRDLSVSDEELTVESATLADAGTYRCTAHNAAGFAVKTTKLIVQMKAAIVIEEGPKKSVAYGSEVQMTCKIVAYPLPKIGWKDSKGTILDSQDIIIEKDIRSSLNLPNVQASDTYTCFAENILGTSESSIDIEVKTPFVIGTQSGGAISAKFGSRTDILCDVKSKFPLRIRWFFKNSSGKSEALTSDNRYKISSAGTTLTILYTDVDAVGTYSCEASLENNDKQKVSFTRNVQISDLTPPVLKPDKGKLITVLNEQVKIPCTIIAGVPLPVVSWQVKKKGKTTFTKLSASGQELVLDRVALSDAGIYRCKAINNMGMANSKTELIVQMHPEVVIEEGSSKAVSYGSNIQITCKIVAFPPPKFVWKNSKGNVLTSEDTNTTNEITSRLNLQKVQDSDTYTCFAENILGTSESSIDIEVKTPFMIGTQSGGVISTKFGSRTDILCDVKSKFPVRIRWFFKNSSGKSEALTSDNRYKISSAGTTLTILYTDVEDVGTYSCEASLLNDDQKKIGFTTKVQIDELTPPVLLTTDKLITVESKQKAKILCTIVAGVPPPVVSWQVKKNGETAFSKLSSSGQELVIDSVALSDAGIYRCEAMNKKRKADKLTELVVKMAPEASIIEGPNATVPYGSSNVFTCRVVGFPLSIITWKDSTGNDLYAKNDIVMIKNEMRSRLKIKNIKSSDTYTCHAANDVGQDTISVQVSVQKSIEFTTQPPATITVKYEEPTTIHCDAKSSMPMKMKWFYQKDEHSPRSEILTSDKYSISSDEHDLLIKSTRLDLIGKYTCEAFLVDDETERKSFTTNVEINNLKVAEITLSNETIIIKKGSVLSAFCITDGIPKPVVTWEFKSLASDVFIAIPDIGEQYSAPNIGYEEAGVYRCTATNDLGAQQRTIEVVVNGAPRIRNSDTVYYGVTGDKVLRVPCEVDGFPEPTITWRKEGEVVTSDSKLSVTKNSIYIMNPTEQDSTNFTCEAKNIYGYDAKNFVADISDFITYNETFNSNIYLKLDESTDLNCILPHSDPQSVRWYVNGENTKFFGTFFSIKNAKYYDDGNYTCRLNTDEGSESLNYVVDVGHKPTFKADAPTTIDWQGNKDDMLDCDVYAKPNAKVEWFYNGELLDVAWPELAIVGWGQYSCKASNVHDSVERTFNVTSDGCLINRTAVNVDHIPLLLVDEQTTWPAFATTSEFYTISKNEIITLECATLDQPDNTFKTLPKVERINAKCFSEDKFMIGENTYKFSELQCKSHVRPSQKFTKTSCMKNGEVVEVGFNLKKSFLRVYEACYSRLDRRALYTKVVMSAVNRENIVTPSFKYGETKTGRHGTEPRKCAYSARWLVNPEDVAYGPAQAATLSDQYNTAAVYEPCEGSSRWSWSGVEKSIEFALDSSDTVTVWTGASQHDSSGIPRYLWKVVMFDDNTFETIVYVNTADPSSSDILCPETAPDRLTDVSDAGDRFTYACSFDDFLKAFKVPLSEFT